MDLLDELLRAPSGHSHVLDAVQALLSDGEPRSAQQLCDDGIARGLLPKDTIAKYVHHAISELIDRERLHGERPTFVELADGRFALNVPQDPFASFKIEPRRDPGLDAMIALLTATAYRKSAPDPIDNGNIGGPFERAVAQALSRFGFLVRHDGRGGEPDVVMTAPLGSAAYSVIFECKSVDAGKSGRHGKISNVEPSEPARFRDRLNAQYAVVIGAVFENDESLNEELLKHGVALWTVDDLVSLLRAHLQYPMKWSCFPAIFAPGRQSSAVADLVFDHIHGDRERAIIALRYSLEEGLAYQTSLTPADGQAQRPVNAPLTIEALTMLVNQRLDREGDSGRVNVDDVRSAMALASHPALGLVSYKSSGEVYVEAELPRQPEPYG